MCGFDEGSHSATAAWLTACGLTQSRNDDAGRFESERPQQGIHTQYVPAGPDGSRQEAGPKVCADKHHWLSQISHTSILKPQQGRDG